MDLPKSGKGLGSGSTPFSSGYSDPVSFSKSAPTEEMSATWDKLRLQITGDLASDWVGLPPSESVAAVTAALDDSNGSRPAAPRRTTLKKPFSEFGRPIEFAESNLAKQVLGLLDKRLSVSYKHGMVQISSNLFINANDLAGDSGKNFIDGGDADQSWFAPWATSFGTRTFVNMRSYVADDGTESVVFFVQGIVGTRPPLLDESGEMLEFEQHLRETRLAELAKRLLYIAETPFPSSLFSMSRQIAFNGVSEEHWPEPFYSIDDFSLVINPFNDDKGSTQLNMHIYPQVVHLGWSLTKVDSSTLDSVVSTVVDSLVRIVSILEDGFRNFSDVGVPYGWEDIFDDASNPESGTDRASNARWIPITHIGDLVYKTTQVFGSAETNGEESGFRWAAEYGAGANVSDAINTLAYSYLIPQGKFDEAVGYLQAAIDLDHHYQSTNAISNLAQVYLSMGDFDKAEATFKQALERSDKFSEGEASLLMGELFLRQQRPAEAKEFLSRAVASGMQPYAEAARVKLESVNANSTPGQHSQDGERNSAAGLKFCVNCGAARASAEQKFCGECGSKL